MPYQIILLSFRGLTIMRYYDRKINYYETDQMGIVHHSNYIRFFEEARCSFMEQSGYPYARLEEEDIISPTLEVSCRYIHPVRYGDTVIFNRVNEETDNIPKLRGSVKAVNPGMSINFLGEDNKIIRIEDHLPFDLNQNPCVIAAEDFGLFYTDAMDNMDRYNGKRVSLIGQAVILREFNGRAFVLQRQAYTCCAADIQMMGVLCFYELRSNFPAGQWLKVTGQVRYFEDDDGQGGKVNVPCLTVEDYAITSKPDNDVIYFN